VLSGPDDRRCQRRVPGGIRSELRLAVEQREGQTFGLTLVNDGRDTSVGFTAVASPDLQAWHIIGVQSIGAKTA
jgi:hypothetical protein